MGLSYVVQENTGDVNRNFVLKDRPGVIEERPVLLGVWCCGESWRWWCASGVVESVHCPVVVECLVLWRVYNTVLVLLSVWCCGECTLSWCC